MPTIRANGTAIAYDWHGPDRGPVMMLIMGLGLPSSAWPPSFIDALVNAGYRVLTFDNRDVGESEKLDGGKLPNLGYQLLRYFLRLEVRAPYQLADMANDARGVLDVLEVDRAHLVGVSMGGMIAQEMALAASAQCISLTSIMSTTNERGLPGAKFEVVRYVSKRSRGLTPETLREYHYGFWPLISSPAYPRTTKELHDFVDRLFERGMSPEGGMRQAVAILAASGRAARLQSLDIPTLVIHGDADPLLPVECGYATAEAIRDAEILIFEGMGHDLPEPLIAEIADAIIAHARVSELARPSGSMTSSMAEPGTEQQA